MATRTRAKSRKETRYVSVVTVHVPSAAALVDMMRFDCCYPRDLDESQKIWALIAAVTNKTKPSDHIVRLVRVAHTQLTTTTLRWESFGCKVLGENHPDEEPMTDEEALALLGVKPKRGEK